jgi:hypothetical protein
MHGGKGTFLHPAISLYVSFANTVSDGQVLGHPLKKDAVYLPLLPFLPLLQFDK